MKHAYADCKCVQHWQSCRSFLLPVVIERINELTSDNRPLVFTNCVVDSFVTFEFMDYKKKASNKIEIFNKIHSIETSMIEIKNSKNRRIERVRVRANARVKE